MFTDIFVKGFVIFNLFFSLFCKSSIDRIRALNVFLKSTVLSHLLPMHPFLCLMETSENLKVF